MGIGLVDDGLEEVTLYRSWMGISERGGGEMVRVESVSGLLQV